MARNSIAQLDALLMGLETFVLDADAQDLTGTRAEASGVKQLLARQLPARSRRKVPTQAGVGAGVAEKLSFLRRLAVSRPDVKLRLGLAFADRDRPSRDEIDALIAEVTKSGGSKNPKK